MRRETLRVSQPTVYSNLRVTDYSNLRVTRVAEINSFMPVVMPLYEAARKQ